MQAILAPSLLKGTITAPASKSAMQRACAAALIRKGETRLFNAGVSADDLAALNIIEQLGAKLWKKEGHMVIESRGIAPVFNHINCGESGLSVRMFTFIAALFDQTISIKGSGSLLKRPMHFFDEVLPGLNVVVESNNGYLPLEVMGPLIPKDITVDGSLSSQYLTGLLFAYSAADAKNVTISVRNLNSKPYIDLTLDVLTAFGLKTPVNKGYKSFYFDNTTTDFNEEVLDYTVEGDWSGAAFLLVGGAVTGNIIVKGLDINSVQADKAILQPLMQAGAVMSIHEAGIEIRESNLKAFQFNATDCPDLFPPLVALAAFCEGKSVIEGVHRLTYKESNRAHTLQQEFLKMGVEINIEQNHMLVKGNNKIRSCRVTSHHDHRIAMACAIAALKSEGEVVINDADAVNKSFPAFWNQLQNLGATVSLNHN